MGEKVVLRKEFNVRALASMVLLCSGVWLVPSGIALHFASHEGMTKMSHIFMTMHNTASLLFLIAVVVHVMMNRKVLSNYINARMGEYMRFKRELLIAVLGVSALVLFAAFHALHLP